MLNRIHDNSIYSFKCTVLSIKSFDTLSDIAICTLYDTTDKVIMWKVCVCKLCFMNESHFLPTPHQEAATLASLPKGAARTSLPISPRLSTKRTLLALKANKFHRDLTSQSWARRKIPTISRQTRFSTRLTCHELGELCVILVGVSEQRLGRYSN